MMVTSGLAVWNAAIQASWALPWLEAPIPVSVPVRVEADSVESLAAGASFAAQAESASAAGRKSAAGAAIRESFTEKSLSGFLLLGWGRCMALSETNERA